MKPKSSFTSTNSKNIIRRTWNAPLLDYLKTTFNTKLLYFGLPSPNAEDIFDWIDFIDFVIAFQCRDYPKPSDPSQNDSAVKELEFKLNKLQRQNLIKDFMLYDGYIEEVIINGKDNDNYPFDLKHFVTLYNLDFCNEITFPQKILNERTNEFQDVYKLHVIKKIMDLQNENNFHPYKFVIFLTVKANFWITEAEDYVSKSQSDALLSDYFNKISSLTGIHKSIRILKAYIFKSLSSMLCINNYIPEFLPVVWYKGSGIHDLAQFTIICTHELNLGRGALHRQDFNQFLNQGFLMPNEAGRIMEPVTDPNIEETIPSSDPIVLFRETVVYEEFWR